MVPLLAASTAISTVDQLGSGVSALWRQLTASRAARKSDSSGEGSLSAADSFAALLPGGTGHLAVASAGSSKPDSSHSTEVHGRHSTAQRLDRLA